MVFNIILIFVGLSIFYAYTNHNRQFSATASAIQQIWTGTCRLSCRENQRNGYNALSGLIDPASIVNPESIGEDRDVSSCIRLPDECICETCPCSLLEKVLKTCRPATNIYSQCIEIMSDLYCDIVRTLGDLYGYIEQVMINAQASQTQPQLIQISSSGLGPSKSTDFSQKVKDDLKKANKAIFNVKPSRSITFRKKSDINWEMEAGSSKTSKNLISGSQSNLSNESSRNCSRCNEKGASCPILCVTKAILFALVAIFILYLPLGDPAVQCNPECEGKLLGLCCFCDIYRAAVKITNNAKEIGEQLFCMLQNMLYQLKFKFYGMLNKMDRNDLCRTITCSDSAEKTEDKRPTCKCSRRCCKKKSEA